MAWPKLEKNDNEVLVLYEKDPETQIHNAIRSKIPSSQNKLSQRRVHNHLVRWSLHSSTPWTLLEGCTTSLVSSWLGGGWPLGKQIGHVLERIKHRPPQWMHRIIQSSCRRSTLSPTTFSPSCIWMFLQKQGELGNLFLQHMDQPSRCQSHRSDATEQQQGKERLDPTHLFLPPPRWLEKNSDLTTSTAYP